MPNQVDSGIAPILFSFALEFSTCIEMASYSFLLEGTAFMVAVLHLQQPTLLVTD